MLRLNDFLYIKGRIGRLSWWIAMVILSVSIFALRLLNNYLANSSIFFSIILAILMIILAAASIVVSVKRLHDLNLSGWYYIIFLILNYLNTYVAFLILFIVLGFIKGTTGNNKYDFDPLQKPVDKHNDGEKAKLSKLQIENIQKILHQHTPKEYLGHKASTNDGQFWTVDDLALVVRQQHGIEYQSRSSYSRLFHLCGFSYQKAEKVFKSDKVRH